MRSQPRVRRPYTRFALAASVLVAAIFSVSWALWPEGKAYRTDIGEQRSLTLADGSSVLLDASSRIRVDFTAKSRRIELLRGQALFSVAKDAARPFSVESGPTTVVAIGTQFDVNRRSQATVVTVVEGRVSVRGPADKDAQQTATLSAGQQLVADLRETYGTKQADVTVATAWTRRRLVFSATPLVDVAETYNRYHSRRLVIRDAQLHAFSVSGTFSSTDAASLVDFLREQSGIVVRETEQTVEVGSAAAFKE